MTSDSSNGDPKTPGESATTFTTTKLQEVAKSLTAKFENLKVGITGLYGYVDAHVVIVSSAGLDKNLERALLTKMLPLSRDFRERIFDGYGPLSNFAAKIDIAFALGLVPKQIFDDLKSLNRVRVRFAHTTKIKDFQDPEIAGLLEAISGMDPAIPDLKQRLLKRLKEIDLHLDAVYAAHCKAIGQIPTDVDASLLS